VVKGNIIITPNFKFKITCSEYILIKFFFIFTNYMNYDLLPEEIKSKIMFSGSIIHPVAVIFKEFKDDYCHLLNNVYCLETLTYNNISFYDYLYETNYFRNETLTFEELENIISFHLYIPNDSD